MMEGFGLVLTSEPESSQAAMERLSRTLEPDSANRIYRYAVGCVCLVACAQSEYRVAVDTDDEQILLCLGDVWEAVGDSARINVPSPSEMHQCWTNQGERGMHRFDGCWTLIAVDIPAGEVTVVTDRFNSHPVYWNVDNSGWVLGSTVQTVALGRSSAIELDEVGIFQLLHFQRLFGTRTIVSGVQLTRPGSWLKLQAGSSSSGTWFSYDYKPESKRTREWAELLADTFKTATQHVAIPGETSLLLSGGLDSRMVLACTSPPIQCLHLNDHENREATISALLAGIRDDEYEIRLRPRDYYSTIINRSSAIGSSSYNFVHAHALGLLGIPSSRTLIHGFAPELYFRGTTLPRRQIITGLDLYWPGFAKITRANIIEKLLAGVNYYTLMFANPSRILRKDLQQRYLPALRETLDEIVREAQQHSENPFDWHNWIDTYYQSRYPSYLFAMSLRAEYRERSVTMQNAVLDLHLRMPVSVRSDSKVWVQALSLVNPDIASVPNANDGLPPNSRVPSNIRNAVKRFKYEKRRRNNTFECEWFTDGSWPDYPRMIATDRHFNDTLKNACLSSGNLPDDIFNIAELQKVFDDATAGNAMASWVVLVTATLGSWCSQFN